MPVAAPSIAELRARIARIDGARASGSAAILPFHVDAIDGLLPGGGLRRGALHEVREAAGAASAHAAAATLFTAAIAARLGGPVLWVAASRDLFAPGLAAIGLGPDRLLHADAHDARGVLALVEEGLAQSALAAVIGEVRAIGLAQSRRLQLAAEASGVTAFMLMRWSRTADEAAPSAAMSRWRIGSSPSAALAAPGLGRARLAVELLRCRGSHGGRWIVEAPDEEGNIVMAAELADRSLDQGASPRRIATAAA